MATELDARIAELSNEIRRYPTPIARCDEQLTELLERRARLFAEKARAAEKVEIGEIGDRPRFSVPQSEVAPLNDAEKRGLSPTFQGCSPDNIWINDGGYNAA
jgi:hypothetical protein